MDARTQGDVSSVQDGDEATAVQADVLESIEAERSRRTLALIELANLQNELGLTE